MPSACLGVKSPQTWRAAFKAASKTGHTYFVPSQTKPWHAAANTCITDQSRNRSSNFCAWCSAGFLADSCGFWGSSLMSGSVVRPGWVLENKRPQRCVMKARHGPSLSGVQAPAVYSKLVELMAACQVKASTWRFVGLGSYLELGL